MPLGYVWVAYGCIFQPVQRVDGLPAPFWYEMALDVYGELDVVMSHLPLDVGQ